MQRYHRGLAACSSGTDSPLTPALALLPTSQAAAKVMEGPTPASASPARCGSGACGSGVSARA